MAARERGDLFALIERLVSLSVRVVDGRLELLGIRLGWLVGGSLLLTVALGMLAASVVEALSVLIASRVLRYLLVSLPLGVGGVVALWRAARVGSMVPRELPDESPKAIPQRADERAEVTPFQ